MVLDRACTAHEPPSESTHCLNLGTRGKEEQRATLRDVEESCGGRKTEDGFCHLDGSCYCGKKQSRMDDTSQWPYSPRAELGISSSISTNSLTRSQAYHIS